MLGIIFADNVYPYISVRQAVVGSSGSSLYSTLLAFAKKNDPSGEALVSDALSDLEEARKFFTNDLLEPATKGFIDQCFNLYTAAYVPALNISWTASDLAKKLSGTPLTWALKGNKRSTSGGPCAHVDVLSALYNMGAYEAALGNQAVTMQATPSDKLTKQCTDRCFHFLRAAYYFKHAVRYVHDLPEIVQKLMAPEYSEDFFSVYENFCIGMGFEAVLRANIPNGLKTLTREGDKHTFANICSLARAAIHYYKMAIHMLDGNKEMRKVVEPKIFTTIYYKRAYYYSFAYLYVGVCMRTDAHYYEALSALHEAQITLAVARKDLEKAPFTDSYKQLGMKPALETLATHISQYLDALSIACKDMKATIPDALIDMPGTERTRILEMYTKVGRDVPKVANPALAAAFRRIVTEKLPEEADATYAKLEEYLKELAAAAKGARTVVTDRHLTLAKKCATICSAETNQVVHKYFRLLHNIFLNFVPFPLEHIDMAIMESDGTGADRVISRLSGFKKEIVAFRMMYKDFCDLIAQTGKFPVSYQHLKTAVQNTELLKTADQKCVQTYGSKYWDSIEFHDILDAFVRKCKDSELSFKEIGLLCTRIKEEVINEGLDRENGKLEEILEFEKKASEIATIINETVAVENNSVDYDALSKVREITDLPTLLELYKTNQIHPKFVTYAYSLAAQAYSMLLAKYDCTLADLGEDKSSIYSKAETTDNKAALAAAQQRVEKDYKEITTNIDKMCTVLEQFVNNVSVQQCILAENPSIGASPYFNKNRAENEYERMQMFIGATTDKMSTLTASIDLAKKKIDECAKQSKDLLEVSLARTKNYNSEVKNKNEQIKARLPIKIETR